MSVDDGEQLLELIKLNSTRNGAAMRAYVIGVLKDEVDVLVIAALQARVTHNTQLAVEAAQAVALMAHYFIYQKGGQQQVGTYLESRLGGSWNTPWQGEVGMTANEAVQAAVTLIKQETSLSQMLRQAINFGGDVDTVAAITLGCASRCTTVQDDLPAFLVNQLENGPYGRDYLQRIDNQLFS
ncbi:ADP-ribosylglycohydrolase family protein [Fibrella sp. HMF5036]|uniref:ADP-ribosylglycohydrolase family protein n=1 Tax=Fibrella aquatilis TaxID=2817059 RepID=A0A939GCM6_9BACT|nr:ADP-ribosylglycohydrolase family protein [Fibrella aquatilis]